MTDLLEHRLTEAARRWQAAQPPPPEVPVDRLVAGGRRRSTYAWMAAAAVAVVVGGIAYAVARPGPSRVIPVAPPPWVTSTQHVGPAYPGTVPWAPLPARHPQVRTTLPPNLHRPHRRIVTPYDGIAAYGVVRGTVHPGDTLTFTLRLLAPHDTPLRPCPDFEIAFGAKSFHQWQLNCSAVPYLDRQGRPYLPAGTRVPFAMRVTVPDEPGRQKVLWTLEGPQSAPGFYGIVRVVR